MKSGSDEGRVTYGGRDLRRNSPVRLRGSGKGTHVDSGYRSRSERRCEA